MGTLTLDEEQQGGKTIEEAGAALIAKHTIPEVVVSPVKKLSKKIRTTQAVVLENAAHGFVKPNILDIKLGVRLWADDADSAKRARFDKVANDTTHKKFGFRIAGMRVWQGHGAKGEGIDADGYKVYDKFYGRQTIQDHNLHDAFHNFLFVKSAGVDEELGKLVAQAFTANVSRIQEIIEAEESRMFSSSLLFVFEGDGEALRAAMEEASRSPATLVNGNSNGFVEDDEEDLDEDLGPKIYTVKVIDFAHAQWTPGLGPDENALTGIRSVVKFLGEIGGES